MGIISGNDDNAVCRTLIIGPRRLLPDKSYEFFQNTRVFNSFVYPSEDQRRINSKILYQFSTPSQNK